MPFKMVGKKRVFVEDEVPQKTVQPVKATGLLAPVAAPAPVPAPAGSMSLEQLLKRNIASGQILEPLAKQAGAQGWEYMPDAVNESGNAIGTGVADRQQLMSSPLAGYTFDWKDTGPANTGTLTAYDSTGKQAGAYNQQDQSTGSALGEFAALAAAGFGGLGALGLGPLGGMLGGLGGAGAAAEGAAAAGAADIGALGLAEGVYGAGGALGAGVAPGTVGGLAGSTAGFGGFGSVLPGVGFGAPSALASAAFDLATVGGPDPAGLVPSAPQPVEFGGQGLMGEPTFTPTFSGGLEPFVPQLPTIGAEATAFGGLPELSTLAAGAPAETAFGAFGGGLLAPEAAPAFAFNPGAPTNPNPFGGGLAPTLETLPAIGAETTAFGGLPELSAMAASAPVETAFGSFGSGLLAPEVVAPSAFNPNALQSQNPLGGGLGPVAESVPSIAAETTAFGNLPELSALANGAAAATPLGSFALPAQTAPSGLLGTVKDVAAWMKANPQLGRLLLGGATSLLSSSGSNSSGAPAAPSGPPVQWNSALQQGLLSPVQQYAPAAITQNRPAGLLAQGFQNDGAWRYLKG